jgi:ABC-type lipoprotein export system ATPase subunit
VSHPPVLQLDALQVTFRDRPVLRYADHCLHAGEQAALLGPSGSGKSTLLHLIAGLRRPSSGTVRLEGQALSSLGEAARDRLRGARVGLVFQRLHLMPALNVRDNLRLARYCAGLPPDSPYLEHLLAMLQLDGLATARPEALSGGQQQRVAIARALINRPGVVLADEPTASLDDDNARRVLDLLCGAATEAGAALLIATHDARVKARVAQHWVLPA